MREKKNYQSYCGVTWNAEDIIASKNAAYILYVHKGASEEELMHLNFGGLDVAAVLEEINS